jgi:phosphoribosylamine--glycine ligase
MQKKKNLKKNFLFVSLYADINDIAWQVAKEGHNVKYFIETPVYKDVGDGFAPKTDNWRKELDWADVIIFDAVQGQGRIADRLRDKGYHVIGGTPYTDRLEDDRAFGQEELKKAGIPIIPHKDFTSFDAAIKFVQENPGRYVVKPSGKAENFKGLLFVGEEEDGKDVIDVMTAYGKSKTKKIKVFELQKRILGVEVAIGAFFNGKEFIYPINVNFEHKKLFPGNIGPSTGEMGTSMFWSGPNRLFNKTLKKFESQLKEAGYVGYIDLNCIVNNNGIYPLEFTSRFGYPTISIQQEGMLTPISDFLYDLAHGSATKLKIKSGFQIGVLVVVPPFPFEDRKLFDMQSRGSVVKFKRPDNNEGIHIMDLKLVNGEWVVTGDTGLVLIVCGSGQTMKQAQAQAFGRIGNVILPYMYYRKDIGDRWFEDSDKLNTWGYLREV